MFLLWRTVGFAVPLLAPSFIPYLGFFPYKELLLDYRLPAFINALASFDGTQYLTLVREGYNTYTQAYFPLYFLLVRLVSFLFPTPDAPRPHNDLLAALFVSNLCFAAGLYFFRNYLFALFGGKKKRAYGVVALLLLFPTSFYFGAVYTEGLFFLLVAAFLYFLRRKTYLLAALAAALASATRLMGAFLFIPLLFHFLPLLRDYLKRKKWLAPPPKLLYLISPFVGLTTYCTYLWITVGDPFFFFNAQPAFGANRSTSLITLPQVYYRYIRILFTAAPNFQYFVSLFEMLMFTFVCAVLSLDFIKSIKKKSNERIGLNIFSFVNMLLPTLTGTFSSVPRYALFSLSLFLFLGELENKTLKIILSLVFAVLHIVVFAFFAQGYFVG